MRIIGKFLWWASLVGGVLMFGAGVSPQDASSNLAAWLQLSGVDNPPAFLQWEHIDVLVFCIGLSIIVLAVGFKLWDYFFSFIPLPEASKMVYDNLRAQRNSRHIRMAESSWHTTDEILNYFATAIATCIDIYGVHQPGTKRELIQEKYHLACNFKDGGNVLKYHGNTINAYENCSIKKSALRKAKKDLRNWKD